MRNLGELWHNCQTGVVPYEEWEYQRYLLIDNVQYFDDEIKDVSFDRGLIYDTFGLGNCISSKLSVTIIPKPGYNIPKNAQVIIFVRIATVNDGVTPWIPFGTYYVHNRTQEADKLKLETYDSIRALETPYLDGTEQINWPIPCTEAIVKILNFMGVELDPRTVLNPEFFVHSPERMTMRQVLMYIGSMHAGNWYLTEENKLRLVVPSIGTPVAYIDKSNSKRIMSGTPITYDNVKVTYGQNDDDVLFAGTGTTTLSLSNPWATQEIVDGIYEVVSNHTYRPFDITSADIDPAIELGDTLDVEGELVAFWQVAYTLRMYATISIPPPPSEGGIYSEFGGDSSSLQNVYFPVVRWDFNTDEIKVGQLETQIAAIDVNVTIAGHAQGMFNVTLISDRTSDVIIRIYDNDVQQLYSPITKRVNKGFNQIGIPHSYIRLKTGLHLFTITIQTRQGEILMSTRSVMYSIELFSVEVAPIDYEVRDITLRQPVFALEPTDVYLATKHDEGYLMVLTARYIYGRRYFGTDFNIHWELLAIEPEEVAIEFDGIFRTLEGQTKQTLVTKDKPNLFWIDADHNLFTQYGDEYSTQIQLATGATKLFACRGWGSESFPENDMGLVVAYLKQDGKAYYRYYLDNSVQPNTWMSEAELPFTQAELPLSSISCHRLNDYRMVFSVQDASGNIWSVITRRYYQSGLVESITINIPSVDINIGWASYINPVAEEAWNTSNYETYVRFSHPLIDFVDKQSAFVLRDVNNVDKTVVSTEKYDDYTIKLNHDSISGFAPPLRVIFTNSITNGIEGPLLVAHGTTTFAIQSFSFEFDAIDFSPKGYGFETVGVADADVSVVLTAIGEIRGYNEETISVKGVDVNVSLIEVTYWSGYHPGETIEVSGADIALVLTKVGTDPL